MWFGIRVVFQTLLFIALPFMYWKSIRGRKKGFLEWTGLKPFPMKPKKQTIELGILCLAGVVFFVYAGVFVLPKMVSDPTIVAHQYFKEINLSSIIGIFFFGLLVTGLSEEVLFRGFLGKFFIKRTSFFVGNFVQALLFGIFQGILVFGKMDILSTIVWILLMTGMGYYLGYLVEKKSNGSIIPGWAIQTASVVVVFFLNNILF